MNPVSRYTRWLHTQWPAGTVERLPDVREDGTTAVPGVRITGDLTGIPLLKFSSDTGARAVQAILREPDFASRRRSEEGVLDLAIVGAGVSGIAAAIEAKSSNLTFAIFEAAEPFATVVNFPRAKPIYTYPVGMTPAGKLQFRSEVHPKETLLQDLENARRAAGVEVTAARIERIERNGDALLLHHGDGKTVTRARRVVVAIGRSGEHRKLGIPGEELEKVFDRLHDPRDFAGRTVLVVGGGDSALETAIALAGSGAEVTLSYRRKEFSRPKPENVESLRASAVSVLLGTRVQRIEEKSVVLEDSSGKTSTLPNDVVFTMLGREAPLAFFRRSRIPIRGEWTVTTAVGFALFLLFCVFLYNWKANGAVNQYFQKHRLFPYNLPALSTNSSTLLGTLTISLEDPGFYYSLAYCTAVLVFGIQRIRRRKTPYVRRQTIVLTLDPVDPALPAAVRAAALPRPQRRLRRGLREDLRRPPLPRRRFRRHGREYWRAFGFILAWPLFIWNVFSWKPMSWWLAICFVQTFVLIPLMVRRWGKGAYCGWICSCGALAETLGRRAPAEDAARAVLEPRQHGGPGDPGAGAPALRGPRDLVDLAQQPQPARRRRRSTTGCSRAGTRSASSSTTTTWSTCFSPGIVGVGFYFWFSGRVWCRFACPLAALMHIYARFTRFRIFAEKSKCISCNVCTTVCHQGIDIMSFANKGLPMEDPRVRALLGLRPDVPDRRPLLRPLRGYADCRCWTGCRPRR